MFRLPGLPRRHAAAATLALLAACAVPEPAAAQRSTQATTQAGLCSPGTAAASRRQPRRAPAAASGRALRTQVVILGSGDPSPDPDRQGPAVAIVVDSTAYLVDAGVGVVRRASQAAMDRRIRALAPNRLSKVFITHLHSDHTLGIPDLMFTPWIMGRTGPLVAWGPAGLQAMGDRLVDAWSQDITMRQGWEKAGDTLGYRVVACELPRSAQSAVVYHDGLVTVTAFAVSHGDWNQPWSPPADTMGNRAFGYRFDTPDLSVVVSGDTRPDTAAFARFCNGCDILLHEVYAVHGRPVFADSARNAYDRAFHTSSVELGRVVAPAARPKLLVLYHASHYPGVSGAELLREVTSRYRGRVCLGHDLDVFRQGAASACAPAEAASRRRR